MEPKQLRNVKNVLIIQNRLLQYRKPLYNLMADRYNLTVLHSGDSSRISGDDRYDEIIVRCKKIGPLRYQYNVLGIVRKGNYDIIIAMRDLHWIKNIIICMFHQRSTKFIWWGGWFNGNIIGDNLKLILAKYADSNIFYSQATRNRFEEAGVPSDKLAVANNTVYVSRINEASRKNEKNHILVVGRLDKRKQTDKLIIAFKNSIQYIPSDIRLLIVGEGEQSKYLDSLVQKLKLDGRVVLLGQIFDMQLLASYYGRALFSVSFGQAGLSVLQSFAHGVPYITKKNAISGGEIFNIKHGYNGWLCDDSVDSFQKIIVKLCTDVQFALHLGENAYSYYNEYCTMQNMAQGFFDAIEGTQLVKVSKA